MRIKIFLIPLSLMFGLVACGPTNISCGDTQGLIAAIEHANNYPAATNTIDLAANCVYEIDAVHSNFYGDNGLPVISSPIVINGNGSTIVRVEKPPNEFRIFFVTTSGSLTLNDLYLYKGSAFDPGNPAIMANNSGGAIFNNGDLNLSNVTIKGNQAHGEGGGIMNLGVMTIERSTIMNNECFIEDQWSFGGGAGITNYGEASINMSVISDNSPELLTWDGIFNSAQGVLHMTNSTISGNGSAGIDNEGEATLSFVTMANGPVSISSWSGNITVSNSIFADAPCLGNAINPVGNNIDTDGTCGVFVTVPYDQLFIKPLALNGGTTFTHALLSNSPAIDGASTVLGITAAIDPCPPTDQRGEPRPSGNGCDLGAYEYQGLVPVSSPSSNLATLPPTSTNTPTPTSTATPNASACKWFDQDEMSLVLFDIKPGSTDLTFYVKNPPGIPGHEFAVEGFTGEWLYTAFLGDVEAEKCAFEGYAGRLHCYFYGLPPYMLDTTQSLEVHVNHCPFPIFTHEGVSIISPELPPTSTVMACSSDLGPSACAAAGGSYTCTIPCTCDCGP